MKKNTLNKTIKFLTLISSICLMIISIGLIAGKFINWNICGDHDKHLAYNIFKYTTVGMLAPSVPAIFMLFFWQIKKHEKTYINFYNWVKIAVMALILIFCYISIFTYTKKYYIAIEIWYGHLPLFISLVVLLSCLSFSYFILHIRKNMNKAEKNNDFVLLFKNIKNYCFILEIVWLAVCSVLGFIVMFNFDRVSQIVTAIIVVLLIEMCLQTGFIYLIKRKKMKNNFADVLILIYTCEIAIFVLISYFCMYPTNIINLIKINNFVSVADFIFTLTVIPLFIIETKSLKI